MRAGGRDRPTLGVSPKRGRHHLAPLGINRHRDGRVYLRDDQGRLVAEMRKFPGRSMVLGLDPGVYQLILARPGEFFEAQFELAKGEPARIDLSMLQPAPGESAVLPIRCLRRSDPTEDWPWESGGLSLLPSNGARRVWPLSWLVNFWMPLTAEGPQ